MRVLIVHNHYRSGSPSGERSVVEQESAGLIERGHEVVLFERFSDDLDSWGPVRKAGLPIDAVWGFSSRGALREFIVQFKPDVVHLHNLFPLISPSVISTCARLHTPVVATFHNYKLQCAQGNFFRRGSVCTLCADGRVGPALNHACFHGSRLQTVPVVGGMLLHRGRWRHGVSAYIFISASQRDLMRPQRLPDDRCFVKWNFVSTGAGSGLPRGPQVTYVGRLEPAKGIRTIMQGWDALQARLPASDLRLSIVGGGPMEAQVASWASTRDTVEFHGLLPRRAAMSVLEGSLCSVVPSLCLETFGLVAVESMALGVAPVVAGHGALPELVENGVSGLVFRPGDSGSLADALVEADRRPERFVALGEGARARYLRCFTPARGLERLEQIYEFAIEHPVRGS